MTSHELGEILSSLDMGKICEEMRKHGFRLTNTDCFKEFPYDMIFDDCLCHKDTLKSDTSKREKYLGTVYSDGEKYKGVTFVTVTHYSFKKELIYGADYVPAESAFFTNAPYDGEFASEINMPCRCDGCKNKFVKKDMINFKRQILCFDCYADLTDGKYLD